MRAAAETVPAALAKVVRFGRERGLFIELISRFFISPAWTESQSWSYHTHWMSSGGDASHYNYNCLVCQQVFSRCAPMPHPQSQFSLLSMPLRGAKSVRNPIKICGRTTSGSDAMSDPQLNLAIAPRRPTFALMRLPVIRSQPLPGGQELEPRSGHWP
jgi:hypothetical protein